MIRKAILTLGVLAATASAYAQSKQPCATDDFYREQKAHFPGIAAQEAQLKADIDKYITNRLSNPNAKTTHHDGTPSWPDDVETFHIPVVVHVISDYTGGAANISDNDIYGMIARMNTYYSATNSGIPASIIAPFKPYIGNAHVTFHLANKDPKGKPTHGITRHFSQHAAGGDELAKMQGWAPDQYLNIWLENYIGRSVVGGVVQAYATFPTSYTDNPYSQGIISRADQALASGGSTLAHEVGHFLFLYHVWNSNNAGPDVGVCGDDEVDDTPPTEGHFNKGCRLYDTLCATGYFKNYDSATYEHMTGVKRRSIIDSNGVENIDVQYSDSPANFIGQTFTTDTAASYLGSISVLVNSVTKGGALQMSLYNSTGTTLIAKSDVNPGSGGAGLLKFDFNGNMLAANTQYKFEIDTFGGGRRTYALRAASSDAYPGGIMYTGPGANTPAAGNDLYFKVERLYRIDYPDTANTQNIMDYSSCPTEMFTKGQVARMRGALRSEVGMRSKLISKGNIALTGIWDTVANVAIAPVEITPIAAFSVNRPFVCADQSTSVQFTNRSYNNWNAIQWTFDHGAQDPQSNVTGSLNNTFSQPGWVNVSLTASNTAGTETITRSNAVYAADPNPKNPIGYYQEFNRSTVVDSIELASFPIFNFFGTNHKWEVVNNAGYYDNTSIRYANYDTRAYADINNLPESPRGDYADFYTPAFDLSNFGNVCNLSFFSAGAFRTNKPSEMNDSLEISMSLNCGLSWTPVDILKGGRLANAGYRNDRFKPNWMSEWKEQSIPVSARTNQVFFRFRFKAGVANPATAIYGFPPYSAGLGTGNDFYLDRFTITNTPLGVKNGVIVNLGMNVAPNPTSGAATVSLNGGDNSKAEMTVTDVTGKLVYSSSVVRAATTTKIEIPASVLTVKGMYLVKVVTNGATETQKLVVY